MLGYIVFFLLLVWGGVLGFYARDLRRIWREPVLLHPVLIVESDDWGAGPVEAQTAALNGLSEILARHRDGTGRPAVMTLAMVLAVADGAAIRVDGNYHRRQLDDPLFAPVLDALKLGVERGVFALQLHGLEHYWPAALMASADALVQDWLRGDFPPSTEKLPSPLQSRWVDASRLPSRPLAPAMVDAAVGEEVRLYADLFGQRPAVAVPPTFVWTADVEQAWSRQGIEFVVTPGLRSACRDATGLPGCDTGPFFSAQPGEGVTYLVRDDYFEPERGHRAEHALAALDKKWAEGRACLLETHRSNFLGDPLRARAYMLELDRLYTLARAKHPALRFLPTEALGRAMRDRDPAWIDWRWRRRLGAWLVRIRALHRFWRCARITGLSWVLLATYGLSVSTS